MVDSSDKTGLTVIFILYMLILIASGLWGWWKQRKRIQGSTSFIPIMSGAISNAKIFKMSEI